MQNYSVQRHTYSVHRAWLGTSNNRREPPRYGVVLRKLPSYLGSSSVVPQHGACTGFLICRQLPTLDPLVPIYFSPGRNGED